MKKGLKITFIIVAILVVAVIAMAIALGKDLKQEADLSTELDSLYELLENYPLKYDEIEAKVSKTVTTGEHEKVEKSAKNYISDFASTMKKLDDLFEDKEVENALTVDNFKSDGPNFVTTQKKLSDASTSLEELSSQLNTFFTEEGILSYIQDKNLDEYYTDLYKKQMLGEQDIEELENARKEIMESLNEFSALIKKEQQIIEFLAKNKGSWVIEDDQIVFYSNALVQQYSQLVSEL